MLYSTISHSDTITNSISGKTCTTTGDTCKTPDVIYAAECTFHNKLDIGPTSQPLNMRFNGHHSDAKIKPTACELAHHFHHNTCNKDLRFKYCRTMLLGQNIIESFGRSLDHEVRLEGT